MNDGYHGWSNRETWAANLWIENTKGDYHESQRLTRSAVREHTEPSDDPESNDDTPDVCDVDAAVETLTDTLESAFSPECVGGLAGDLLQSAINRIDWSEIAQSMVDEMVSEQGLSRKSKRHD